MISRELGSTQLEPESHTATGAMQICLCCPSGGMHRTHHLLKHQMQLGSSRRPHMQEERGLNPPPSSPVRMDDASLHQSPGLLQK